MTPELTQIFALFPRFGKTSWPTTGRTALGAPPSVRLALALKVRFWIEPLAGPV